MDQILRKKIRRDEGIKRKEWETCHLLLAPEKVHTPPSCGVRMACM